MLLFCTVLVFSIFVDNICGVRVFAPEKPVMPNVTAMNPTEIKVTWCRVNSNRVEIDHYELFIDNELEYSGIDIIYVAKRLKPFTRYEVKLRACGVFPNRCSVFSRKRVIKTPKADGNVTEPSPTSTAFVTIMVVPSFMIGVIVGILVISLLIIWRYFYTYVWLSEPMSDLPWHTQHSPLPQHSWTGINTHEGTTFSKNIEFPFSFSNAADTNDSLYKQLYHVNNEKLHLTKFIDHKQTSDTQKNCTATSIPSVSSFEKADDVCSSPSPLSKNELLPTLEENCFSPGHQAADLMYCKQDEESANDQGTSTVDHQHLTTSEGCLEIEYSSSDPHSRKKSDTLQNVEHTHRILNDSESDCKLHHELQQNNDNLNSACQSEEINCTSTEFARKPDDILVVIDNSNIYIGAQECASSINANDRKRNVRVKLQHLVKILERGRIKDRAFACGSSPPACEPVWDVYRRLGYTVDLEDRRGKDEQRVDEGLHLCIYKALCELPPSILVLATGDGTRGKSEFATSFPGCAAKALERGWQVELHSWKHSLSAEWNKLAKKFPGQLTITYLDQYVNYITFVDGKNGRKCLPLSPECLMKP